VDEPKPLDSLFKEKLFRIPDYQRGYAWGKDQLNAFWEDLVSLPPERSHYTGVLTLKQTPSAEITENSKEFWLIDDHSYKQYHIVDGQQRLTTVIIFLQAFMDVLRELPENLDRSDDDIYITETLTVTDVTQKFLYMVRPQGDEFRTYKFGYAVDNPSDQYMRHRILDEDGGGTVFETFYTLNLSNARTFFVEQLRSWYKQEQMPGLQRLYRTLTKRFLFNEYIIKDEFDVFVAFETMNNRGKKLSDLELLKNRLIYLTTLYTDEELDPAARKSLRDSINDAWKEVYFQLGRNRLRPLNDDDFLKAHWTMYFKYSRQTGRDYVRFLLEDEFTPKRVHRKVVQSVTIEETEEQAWDEELNDAESESDGEDVSEKTIEVAELRPTDIRDYVLSLKDSSTHWFRSFYPELTDSLSTEERTWLLRLNRLGMIYFRPLVMAILKNVADEQQRIETFQQIERFVFVVFRLTTARSNYRSSEFYNFARALDRGETTVADIKQALHDQMAYTFTDGCLFDPDDFLYTMQKKFDAGQGFYGWPGLRYFLYEYELSLLSKTRHQKVDWSDLLKTGKDRISIEHIYPQTETSTWADAFSEVSDAQRVVYNGSLGNLLLLSSAINSSLQNDSFEGKKKPKLRPDGSKLRNGYSDGSHSEIEVSCQESWGPKQIRDRGLKLLKFMEERWQFHFSSEGEKLELLFPDLDDDLESDMKDDS
jgi:hypothetical protein